MNTELRKAFIIGAIMILAASTVLAQDDDSSRQILKQGLLGAGTGAIAASASGGNAGKGALIGAGTNVIGSALLDAITGPPASSRSSAPRRYVSAPPQDEYYQDDSEYYYEEPAPQPSQSQQVLKQGLLGAGTGAIAASASGGNAGTGALIGAGTGIIGNALLDTLTQPQTQRQGRIYRRVAPPPQQQAPQVAKYSTQVQDETTPEGTRKKIVRKYDENGKVVSEEEIYF